MVSSLKLVLKVLCLRLHNAYSASAADVVSMVVVSFCGLLSVVKPIIGIALRAPRLSR